MEILRILAAFIFSNKYLRNDLLKKQTKALQMHSFNIDPHRDTI